MKNVYIEKASLANYRNFESTEIQFEAGVNIIAGPNGAGKTNILESISLLSPGRGLKSCKLEEIMKGNEGWGWRSNFILNSKLGIAEIASEYSANKGSRKITYNGSKASSAELTNLLNLIWLTPQMEGLFLDSASARRRFLDRVVFNFDAKHAKRISTYEHYVRERNKILSEYNYHSNSAMLSALEKNIAEQGVAINDARNKVVAYLQEAIDQTESEFPKAHLELSNIDDDVSNAELNLEYYTKKIHDSRAEDSRAGRATFGVHKTDLIVKHKLKQIFAKICSTGEQKALLISIVIAMIESVMQNTKTTPILLLDELFVHLDEERCKFLSEYILQTKLQTFVTTTDIIHLEYLAKNAKIINL